MTILYTPEALSDLEEVPTAMRTRILKVLERLARWPEVSGAKPLSGEWAGHYRIRTGDWRVVFRVVTPRVIVVRIKHRSEVYED